MKNPTPEPGQTNGKPLVQAIPQEQIQAELHSRIPGNAKMIQGKAIALGLKSAAINSETIDKVLAIDAQAAKEIFGAEDAYGMIGALNTLKLGLQAGEGSVKLRAAMATIRSMSPRNSMEAMLMAQMMLLHEAVSSMIATSRREGLPLSLGAKLIATAKDCSKAYQDGMDAISRTRNGGKQQVVVSHVNVGMGGQAAIAVGGDVRGGGGGTDAKR